MMDDFTRYAITDLPYFEMYGDYQSCFAVHFHSDEELIKRLMAAMKSYTGGYSKIDYVYKNYSDKWKFHNNQNRTEGFQKAYELLSPHLKVFDKLTNAISNTDKSLNIGRFAVCVGMTRLRNTVWSIYSVIAKGYHIETIALVRLLLEQAAWYYSIYEYVEGDFFSIQPHKSIKELKKFIPDVGRLYGELSKYTHVIPSTTLEFVEIIKESQKGNRFDHVVHLSNDRFRYNSMLLYFQSIIVLYKVINEVFYLYDLEFDFEKEEQKLRENINAVEELRQKLSKQ